MLCDLFEDRSQEVAGTSGWTKCRVRGRVRNRSSRRGLFGSRWGVAVSSPATPPRVSSPGLQGPNYRWDTGVAAMGVDHSGHIACRGVDRGGRRGKATQREPRWRCVRRDYAEWPAFGRRQETSDRPLRCTLAGGGLSNGDVVPPQGSNPPGDAKVQAPWLFF